MAKAIKAKSTVPTLEVATDKGEKKVLQPIIAEPKQTITPSVASVNTSVDCVVSVLDKDGNETGNEFTTSLKTWNNVYSKRNNFKLKKK